jgi:hypothetical protein
MFTGVLSFGILAFTHLFYIKKWAENKLFKNAENAKSFARR